MTHDSPHATVTLVFGHDVTEVRMTEQQATGSMAGRPVVFTAEDGEPLVTDTGQLGVRYQT
jgi:hypothetical protein